MLPGTAVRRDLEGLRGIAVIGVVVYHLRSSWLPGGFAGVDVFFVLSGFFITSLLLRDANTAHRVDLRAFWGRRARRLLPAAAVVLIGTMVSGYLFVDALDAKRFAVDGGYAALFSVNWHYAAQGKDYLADTSPTPMQHFWSLGVEEQFYVVWPVVLFVLALMLRRRRVSRHRSEAPTINGRVVAVVGAVSVASFLYAWHATTGNESYAYYSTWSRVWQLGLGAILAAGAARLGQLPSVTRVPLRVAGVAAVVGFYVGAPAPSDIVYPGLLALVPTLGAAAIIAAGLPAAGRQPVIARWDVLGAAMSSRVGLLLGRYSYGWYLWHYPPLVLLPLAVGHRISDRSVIACGVLSLAAAVASYHLIEHPIRASRGLAAHRGRWSLALGAALIVAGVGTAQAVTSASDYQATHTVIKVAGGHALHPNPGTEAKVISRVKADGCELDEAAYQLAKECRYRPDTGHGDVVLVGDSHAAQWFPAVDRIATQQHWGLRVWTRASCPFANITKVLDGGPNRDCNRWRTDVTHRLISGHPSLVIVSDLANAVAHVIDPRTGKPSHVKRADALFRAGLTAQLTLLRRAHIPVLMIRDIPSFVQYGPKCALTYPHDLGKCSRPRAKAMGVPVDVLAAKAAHVPVLDLTHVFCSASRCYQVIGSTLAYHDTNHLTSTMILQLSPRLRAAAVRIERTGR